jgi:ABC-type sugar transport system substrate-binding protein
MRRRTAWTAIIAVGALALAACGSDNSGSGSAATSAAATSAAATTAAPATTSAATSAAATSAATGGGGKGTIDSSGKATTLTLTAAQQAAAKTAAAGKLVGIVAATMDTDYHKTLNEAVKSAAQSYGFEAEIFDSNKDVNKQLQGVEGFISKGAYAIVVTGLGGEGLGPLAKEAAGKGILVVELTGRSLATDGAVTLSVEDTDIAQAEGKAAGQYAKQKYGDTAVQVAITDYPSIESLVKRADQIEQAFKAEYAAADVVGRFLGGTAENGQKSMETALQKYPKITGVLGINDAGNLGAYQALKAAGKTGADVFIFGIDCEPEAKALIQKGDMYRGCVDTNPSGTGELAGSAIALYAGGGTVPGTISVPVKVFTG